MTGNEVPFKIALVSESTASLAMLLMHINYAGKLKQQLGNAKIDFYADWADEIKKNIIEDSAIFDSVRGMDKAFPCGDYDVSLRLAYLPTVLSADGCNKDKMLKAIVLASEDLRNAVSTREFFYADTHYYDSNIFIWQFLNGNNFLNSLDVGGYAGVQKDAYHFSLTSAESADVLRGFEIDGRPFITIRTNGCDNALPQSDVGKWRNWEKLLALVRTDFPQYNVIQLGECVAESVCGVAANLSGRASMSELKWLLENAAVHIDTESSYVHLRNVLTDSPSVVLWGPHPREYFALEGNVNIWKKTACPHWCMEFSDSWRDSCLFQKYPACCMDGIGVADVYGEVQNLLLRSREE